MPTAHRSTDLSDNHTPSTQTARAGAVGSRKPVARMARRFVTTVALAGVVAASPLLAPRGAAPVALPADAGAPSAALSPAAPSRAATNVVLNASLPRTPRTHPVADALVETATDVRKVAERASRTIKRERLAKARAIAKIKAKARAQAAARKRAAELAARSRGDIAVEWAHKMLGRPYVWGASGPSSFDCSGLTSYVWRKAGVSLSHSSRAQIGEGRRVSRSELRPGDLVFYGSPIHHVGIYIGGGMKIAAPQTGDVVKVSSIDRGDYVGAVRPG